MSGKRTRGGPRSSPTDLYGGNSSELRPRRCHPSDGMGISSDDLVFATQRHISKLNSFGDPAAKRGLRDRTLCLCRVKVNKECPVPAPRLLGSLQINLECTDRTHTLKKLVQVRLGMRMERLQFDIRRQGRVSRCLRQKSRVNCKVEGLWILNQKRRFYRQGMKFRNPTSRSQRHQEGRQRGQPRPRYAAARTQPHSPGPATFRRVVRSAATASRARLSDQLKLLQSAGRSGPHERRSRLATRHCVSSGNSPRRATRRGAASLPSLPR